MSVHYIHASHGLVHLKSSPLLGSRRRVPAHPNTPFSSAGKILVNLIHALSNLMTSFLWLGDQNCTHYFNSGLTIEVQLHHVVPTFVLHTLRQACQTPSSPCYPPDLVLLGNLVPVLPDLPVVFFFCSSAKGNGYFLFAAPWPLIMLYTSITSTLSNLTLYNISSLLHSSSPVHPLQYNHILPVMY